MNVPTPTAWLAVCCLLAASPVGAVGCGVTVSGHVTLTADLHCSSGWTALYVDTPGTVIDLNGHTLSGTPDLEAIAALGAHGLTIRGPGTIRGFWAGVNGSRSDDLYVEGVHFLDVGAGVIATYSSRASVINNRFELLRSHAVTISSRRGLDLPHTGGHVIERNVVDHAMFGFELCGQANGGSRIVNNRLGHIGGYGIVLSDGVSATEVVDNSMHDVAEIGILLRASSANELIGNHAKRGWVGIALDPLPLGDCEMGGAAAATSRNRLLRNGVWEHEVALQVGGGVGTTAAAERNRIRDNRFHYGSQGIRFLSDSARNDARRNSYTGTTTPVHDEGTANRW